MMKFTALFAYLFISGITFSQSRGVSTGAANNQGRSSSQSSHSSGYSYSGGGSNSNGRTDDSRTSYHSSHGHSSSYYGNNSRSNYTSQSSFYRNGRPLASSSAITPIHEAAVLQQKPLEIQKIETALLVFDATSLTTINSLPTIDNSNPRFVPNKVVYNLPINDKPSNINSGGSSSVNNNQPVLVNPFYKPPQQLQNCYNNINNYTAVCELTGLRTGFLSPHKCNGCAGYYHYWRTYTNFGCFEYLNERINKVQSIEELKELINSYYDCIDYYQQFNLLDPNTRARFRYGVGH